jgi:hypothetical protein
MKITKQRLKQIIREELENVLLDEVAEDHPRRVWDPDEEGYGYPGTVDAEDEDAARANDPSGRIAKIIPDEDLDPETGERKDALRLMDRDSRVPVPPAVGAFVSGGAAAMDAAAKRVGRAAGNLAAKATHGPRFIPDEDLPAGAQPQSEKRRIAKRKAMAKKR